jgi:hypothetical protein
MKRVEMGVEEIDNFEDLSTCHCASRVTDGNQLFIELPF